MMLKYPPHLKPIICGESSHTASQPSPRDSATKFAINNTLIFGRASPRTISWGERRSSRGLFVETERWPMIYWLGLR